MTIKDNYPNGECPDCNEPIPDNIAEGQECFNCGHVFSGLREDDDTCSCGSGEYPEPEHDGHGIFLFYACDKCRKEKLSHYIPNIKEYYETDEPIESEEY